MNDKIKCIRKKFNITAKELSNKIGIPYRTIVNYENSTRKISSDFIESLVIHLGINANWLLTGKGNMLLTDEKKRIEINNGHTINGVGNITGNVIFSENDFDNKQEAKEVVGLMKYAPPAFIHNIKSKLLEFKKFSEL